MRGRRVYFSILALILITGAVIVYSLLNDLSVTNNNFPLEQKWKLSLPEDILGLSTSENGSILFVRTARKLFAIDSVAGNIIWKRDTAEAGDATPAVAANGTVFLADNQTIWAWDQTSGALRWKQQAHYAVVRSATDQYVAVDSNQEIILYSAVNGNLIWQKTACRNKNLAYFGSQNLYILCKGFRALDFHSGEVTWQEKNPDGIYVSAFKDEILYVYELPIYVRAIDLNSRQELWKIIYRAAGETEIKIIDDKLLIMDVNRACVFQKTSGESLWCAEIPGSQNPVLVGNVLYLFNFRQDEIHAVNFSSGSEIGSLKIKNFRIFIMHLEMMSPANQSLIFSIEKTVFCYH
jgi:outer membrane protein assembly factor BamB